ncbi:hypothetical protein QG37_07672 [Candidozyma auris]|nr:hypothetical protein QG37_07672 [[Candida] auris]
MIQRTGHFFNQFKGGEDNKRCFYEYNLMVQLKSFFGQEQSKRKSIE